jgi:hypothetical protein
LLYLFGLENIRKEKVLHASILDQLLERYKFSFGKHKGQSLEMTGTEYLEWLVNQCDLLKKPENEALKLLLQCALEARYHTPR